MCRWPRNKTLKCLSVSQPFADLIVSNKKTIELRRWNTHFRGEFLVHAPQKIRTQDCRRLKMSTDLVTGAIVGKAELYDVKKYSSAGEVKKDQRCHFASKDYKAGYGFLLKNAKALRVPIPCMGRLGFFEVELGKISKDEIKTDIVDEEYRYQWINCH